ncbi:hypothetical protein BWQ96_05299 [Gracilariopsis chorda]|uniref:Uncharacterized protein n=1 Tax=Gracilariopsis chorda TaxID=448386 RepID=A0A2V3IS31_9FLOR|nr:hypothetical protein BWQ96_05299 [Gracilariopsis chorda]|eukprot:PXF44935.1 hypothetical protein BWQ96_05299 [Gracilariopsis chorda]
MYPFGGRQLGVIHWLMAHGLNPAGDFSHNADPANDVAEILKIADQRLDPPKPILARNHSHFVANL